MQFFFMDVNETIIGTLNSAQKCRVREAEYSAEFAFEDNSIFSFDDCHYVGFEDIDGNLVFYEVITLMRSNSDGLVYINAEHAALSELLDEVIEGKAVSGAMAGFAVSRVIEDTRWTLKSAESTPTMSTTFYYKNVWECLEAIKSATGCALYFNWAVSGNAVTARQIAVKARQGAARGKRFDLSKDLTSITVKEDRSSIYTRIYGRGKGEEIGENSQGETTYGRRIDFADVVWSTASGDPLDKPRDQKYIEDEAATESFGRGVSGSKRPRQAVITFDTCEDAEELLQLTYAQLLAHRYPKLTISAKVIDLEREMGYAHEAIRMGDDVLVIADKWNATYQDSVVDIVRDYLNPLDTEVTIGEEGATSYSLASNIAADMEKLKERSDIGSSIAASNPDLLKGIIDTMVTSIISTGTRISTDPSDGSLLFTASDGNSIVKLTGNGIMIANSKTAGAWDWQTAINGSGIATSLLTAGTIQASIIKILGTEQFYWDASNIYIIDPSDSDTQIRIGKYDGTNYGIAFTTDGGATWQNCIGFSGVTFNASEVVRTVLSSEDYQADMSDKADKDDLDNLSDTAITAVDVQYYLSTSNTTLSGGSWSTTAPAWENGKYMWSRTLITYGDGSQNTPVPTCIAGASGQNGTDGTDGQDGVDGNDGRGIESIVEQYYKSLSATVLTGGSWSTAAPTWESGKFIWTRNAIYYTGSTTPEYTSAICTTGASGSNGSNGTSSYTYIRYSASSSGANMTSAPTATTKYIGICITDSSTAPTTPGSYQWSKYVGENGQDGQDGADGTSVTILGSYDTIAELRAAHPSGDVGDAYIVSGDLYVWSATVSDWVNVGTVQGPSGADGQDGNDGDSSYMFIRYSANADGTDMTTTPVSDTKYIGVCTTSSSIAPASKTDYTWSKYVGENGRDGQDGNDGQDGVSISSVVPYYKIGASATVAPSTPSTTDWSVVAPAVEYGKYLWCAYWILFSDNTSSFATPFMLNGADQLTQASIEPLNPVTGQLWLDTSGTPYELKRYDGSAWAVVSDYSEAITSVYEYVDTSVSRISQTTQQISAYVEEQTVAKSTYDTFTETVRNILSMEADGTTMLFQRISEAISSVDGKQQTNYNEILKYIKFVDGDIILGKTGNEITLTIQNDRLSFKQNGIEIAYLSDSQLYIGSATIQAGGRLTLGEFAFVPRSDGSLSFLKVGGS